jgi:amino acid transporter
MANIGPAGAVVLSFGALFAVAGIASPLIVLMAIVSVALLGNTIAQFAKVHPSAGSFVTLIGKGLGPHAAVTSAVSLQTGYILGTAGVVAGTGGLLETMIEKYVGIDIPWQVLAAVLTAALTLVLLAGVKPSTKVAAASFAFEMIVLFVVAVILLVKHHTNLSLAPFNPGNLTGGLAAIGLGFPLAIFAFVGWENAAGMAEETKNPRKAVGRAVMIGTVVVGATFIVMAYATSVAFNNDAARLASSELPFVDAAGGIASFFEFMVYLATATSLFGVLIAAINAEGRILFNSGREGLIPQWFGRLGRNQTPTPALLTYLIAALALAYVFGWNKDPFVTFGEIATLGTILIVLAYAVSNIALPLFIRKRADVTFNPVVHGVVPVLALLALAYPLYQLVKPGQAAPFNMFPYVALGIVVLAGIYSLFVVRRNPRISDKIGAILTDE